MVFDGNPEKAYTRDVNEHGPCGLGLYTKFAHGEFERAMNFYRGEDCVEVFCRELRGQVYKALRMRKHVMVPLTAEEKKAYRGKEKCHICLKLFDNPKKYKVLYHCHYTGVYRGAAYTICNFNYKIPKNIPVVFHNLSKYVAHLFIRELKDKFPGAYRYCGMMSTSDLCCKKMCIRTSTWIVVRGLKKKSCHQKRCSTAS